MSAHRWQSTWRNITFNQHYDNTGVVDDPAHLVAAYENNHYRLEELDLTQVTTQDFREIRQHLEGADPNEQYEGIRLLTGSGRIFAPDFRTLEDKTWALQEAFSPAACRAAAKSLDPRGVLPFDFRRDTVTSPYYVALRFWCLPSVGRPVVVGRMLEGLVRPFRFQLVALDPFAYGQAEQQQQINPSGTVVDSFASNVYNKPRIRIIMAGAGASNLTITNTTTGNSFVINMSGESAGTFYIDVPTATFMKTTAVTGSNKYGLRVSGYISQLFQQPGNNSWTVTNTTGVTSVFVFWRPAYA